MPHSTYNFFLDLDAVTHGESEISYPVSKKLTYVNLPDYRKKYIENAKNDSESSKSRSLKRMNDSITISSSHKIAIPTIRALQKRIEQP
jgi:hypothetical protein